MAAGAKAFIEVDLIGDATDVYRLLDHLDSCFSPAGQQAFMTQSVVPYLRERAEQRFLGEGDDASGMWAPLSETTVHIRESSGYPGAHPINVRTGELEDYITQGAGTVTVEGSGSTALKYPQASTPGGIKGKKLRRAQVGDSRTPARPVLAVNETDLMFVTQQLAYFIQSYGRGNGGR